MGLQYAGQSTDLFIESKSYLHFAGTGSQFINAGEVAKQSYTMQKISERISPVQIIKSKCKQSSF